MNLVYEIAMAAPKPVMVILIFMLGFGFASVSIMNKNLRRKLRALRRELESALKGHPQPRKKKQTKAVNAASRTKEARFPLRPT